MASTYLTWTPSSTETSPYIKTISVWLKKANPSTEQVIGSVRSSERQFLRFETSGELNLRSTTIGETYQVTTTAKYRDVNGWYHIVIAYDSTQGTASNRVKMYVNGVQVTSFSTANYPASNITFDFGRSGYPIHIGNDSEQTNPHFDGVMSHFHFIDGTAYDATAFGETDSTSGVWKPKTAPSVTYGTNGFFLKFANSASLGTDSSGNGNNFTVNGSGTQTLDTPSNVYATFNPLSPSASQQTMQNGNLYLPGPNSNNWWQSVPATLGATKGKWYWEFKDENAWGSTSDSTRRYGICDLNTISNAYSGSIDVRFSDTTSAYAYMNASGVRYNGSTISGTTSTYPTFSPTDIIQVAMDLDNYKLYFGKNGTWLDSSDPANGTNPVATLSSTATWSPYAEIKYGSDNVSANFGNGYFRTTAISSPNSDGAGEGKFAYTVPTGYYALNTKNLKTYG